jgi:hypothetical protein
MSKEEYREYFEILELAPDSSFDEVKCAYLHLRDLYSSRSPLLSSVADTLSDEERQEILLRIQKAYLSLKEYFVSRKVEKQDVTRTRVENKNIPEFEVYGGEALRLTREVLGIDLEEIAFGSGISLRHLGNIEAEHYDQLPPRGYIKAFVRKYAELLFLDPERVVTDYFKRMDRQTARKKFRFGK